MAAQVGNVDVVDDLEAAAASAAASSSLWSLEDEDGNGPLFYAADHDRTDFLRVALLPGATAAGRPSSTAWSGGTTWTGRPSCSGPWRRRRRRRGREGRWGGGGGRRWSTRSRRSEQLTSIVTDQVMECHELVVVVVVVFPPLAA